MQQIAEIVSLTLTWPTLILGLGVLFHWGKPAWLAFKLPSSERAGTDWLVLGVAVGFLGGILDNSYWGLAWSANYIDHDSADGLFQSGVYFNVPFRQLAGLYAAYCHLRSYLVIRPEHTKRLKLMCWLSLLLGVVYIAALTAI